MSLIQLVYASRPFGFDDATLNAILAAARHANPLLDITGALVCREDLYLQLLEGPEQAVRGLFAAIARDGRHMEVQVLADGPAAARLFPRWAMRDDPVASWMWSPAQIRAGAVAAATGDEVRAIFARVAAEADQSAPS